MKFEKRNFMGIELDVLVGHPEHDLLFVATQVARAAGLKNPHMSATKSVTFKVSRPDGHYGLHKIQDTVFSLGLGPCGRWVTGIEATVTESLLKVVQFSTDIDTTEAEQEMRESTSVIFGSAPAYYRTEKKLDAALVEFHKERYYRCRDILKKARDRSEIKEFVYKLSDVHGRIVIIR